MTDTESRLSSLARRASRRIDRIAARRAARLARPARRVVPGTDAVISTGPRGRLRATRIERRCAVDSLEFDEAQQILVVRGTFLSEAPAALALRGVRSGSRAEVTTVGAGDFECRVPLHAVGWLGQERILPKGDYVLEAAFGRSRPRALVASEALRAALPVHAAHEQAHLRIDAKGLGHFTLRISPPLAPDEMGKAGRTAVTAVKHPTPVVADALYVQSWFGKSFSDSPAPLAQALRDDFATVYVGVQDHSVEIPDFATPVIVGSRTWWEAMTSARVVVDNSWTPRQFKRRRGQHVVQTWHGTPLKKLGYDRSQHEGRASTPQSFKWGSSKWDLLVSPNSYSTEILRRAYTYDGRIAEIGYPRNDVLAGDGELRARVRASLGLAPNEVAVLYAPTFRESEKGRSTFCHVAKLARRLGPGYRLLVRGHSATLGSTASHRGPGVLDVTSYPESSHMLAIADVLVTDYSSVMFDFTATGRPVVFFTPDIDHYAEDGRGVYFDLAASAPGAVIRSERELPAAVHRAWRDRATRSPAYDAWASRFNAYDDGGATERLTAIVREWL